MNLTMKSIKRTILAGGALAICLAGWSSGVGASGTADAVLQWNHNAGEAAKAACITSPVGANPFHESRMYAMMHIAVHDALNSIDRRSNHYAYRGSAPGASPDAAVAAAARTVLAQAIGDLAGIQNAFPLFDACIPGALARVQADYDAALAGVANGPAKDAGIAVGQAAAQAIINLRVDDGDDTLFLDFGYPQGTEPGEWRFTAGAPFAVVPGWGEVTPFVLNGADQFRPRPPYPVSCGDERQLGTVGSCLLYALDLDEVKMYGAKDGSVRSADETEIARFWIESSPLAWNRIGRTVAPGFGLDLWESARLFALLNMGLADGYIASVAAKYDYNFWRPETAIRLADDDGNPWTVGDPDWEPLDPTPPFPDYDSAHAVQGAIAAEVFRRFFRTDHVSFSNCSYSLPDPQTHCGAPGEIRRHYTRFSEAASENGRSRILVGYHFRNAVIAGLQHGRRIGAETVRNYLRPSDR
jgi:hypothetical protein